MPDNQPPIAGKPNTVDEPAPLFLLTTHRSGGTLLARIFNVHPDIVIWGEHAGLINKLAEMAELFRYHPVMTTPLKEREIESFLQSKNTNTDFSPWISAVNPEDFRASAKALMTQFFTYGLRPGQRWGFKEIRYHRTETIEFIIEIFPSAQFVILQRDILQQCISNITAEWSLIHLGLMGAGASMEEALKVIDDCSYALAAIDVGLQKIAKSYPERTKIVSYEALVPEADGLITELYKFAGLNITPEMQAAVKEMLSVRSGATPVTGSLGFITRELIQQIAPECIANAYRAIASSGIDAARLRSRHGVGRYCFVVGDTELKHSNLSSIF